MWTACKALPSLVCHRQPVNNSIETCIASCPRDASLSSFAMQELQLLWCICCQMAFTLFPTTQCLATIEWDKGQLCICWMSRDAWSVHHVVHFDHKYWSSQKNMSNVSVRAVSKSAWQVSLGQLCRLDLWETGADRAGFMQADAQLPCANDAVTDQQHSDTWINTWQRPFKLPCK